MSPRRVVLAEPRHGSLPLLLLIRRAGAAAVARRAGAVLSLFVGALIGVLVLNWLGQGAAFGVIVLVLGGVALASHTLLRRGPDWED